MLTIKKRFPWRRLYLYGSGAVIVGFAGIMAFLVQTNSNLDKFVNLAPAQISTAPIIQSNEQPVSEDDQSSSNEPGVASDSGTSTTWNGISAPMQSTSSSQTSTPSQAEPTPTQPTTPTEPVIPTVPTTPSDPVPVPEDPTIIDEVIDIITP